MTVKLGEACGGDCREIAGTSGALLNSMEKLHDEYLAGVQKNVGKLPVVSMTDTVAVESGGGAKKSTNYHPVFEIVSWVDRPKSLGHGASGSESAPKKAAPPSTGSTRAPAPVPRTPEPEVAEDEDFG